MLSKQLSINTELDYSKEEILEQLNRILSSNLFSHSTILSNFLRFIVEETIEGHACELKEYTIGVSALGKPVDFNPQVDAIVRIHAGRLRRLLKDYYAGPGNLSPIKIEVEKGTYVPAFSSQLIPKKNGNNRMNGDFTKYLCSKQLTIAVLPFRNLCPDSSFQFFVEGFGEELTSTFITCQDIAVIAHHSIRKYYAAATDIRWIGSEFGVHYLINGSVRHSSKEIRVSVGLAETINSAQIWTKSYNYPLNAEKLIDIQDQIVKDVFSILGGYNGFIFSDRMDSKRKKYVHNMQSINIAL